MPLYLIPLRLTEGTASLNSGPRLEAFNLKTENKMNHMLSSSVVATSDKLTLEFSIFYH